MSTILTRILIQQLHDNRGDQGGIDVDHTIYEQTFSEREVDIRAVIRAANTEPERSRAATATEVAAKPRDFNARAIEAVLNIDEIRRILSHAKSGLIPSDFEHMDHLARTARAALTGG